VKYLAENGADVNAKNLDGNTPMHSASMGDSVQCIEILCRSGGKVNEKDKLGLTPLMLAVQFQKEDAVEKLLACKADLSPVDEEGKTALHYAAIAGTGEIIDLLLKNKAKSDVKDKNGHTPSWYAVYYGNEGIAEKLRTDNGRKKSMPDEMTLLEEKELKTGEAVVWYLNHSGWAVKTSNHLLVFDYWQRMSDPDHPCLDNGHINPGEITGNRVMVFASHSHMDHFMQSVFSWKNQISDIQYVLGFNATVNGDYTYIPAHGEKVIDGVRIKTISSTDSGEGFMVEADGVTIFHPGDHASKYEENDTAFYNEIDFLASSCHDIDIAFIPVTGCGFDNKTALEKGNDYIVGKFIPRVVLPMHGSGNEKTFKEYADRKNKDLKSPIYLSAQFRGDRFFVTAGEEERVKL
jgi:L-ascorbate metabolism protein UlaG (beta-lactamase superfamily)